MGEVWSTHLENHYVCSLAWEGYVNTYSDSFSVLGVMGGLWSTQVEIHNVSSLAWDVCQQMLRFILSPR